MENKLLNMGDINNSSLDTINNPFSNNLSNVSISYKDKHVEYNDVPLSFSVASNKIFIPAGMFSNRGIYEVTLKNGIESYKVNINVVGISDVEADCPGICNSCNQCENTCGCTKETKNYDYEVAIFNSQISDLICKYNELMARLSDDENLINDIPQMKIELSSLLNDLSALRLRVSALENSDKLQDGKINEINVKIQDFEKRITKNANDIASNLAKITSNTANITTLQTKVQGNENSINSLTNQHQVDTSRIDKEIADLKTQDDHLKVLITDNTNLISINKRDIGVNTSNVEIERKRNDGQDTRLDELEKLKPRVETNERNIVTERQRNDGQDVRLDELDKLKPRVTKNENEIIRLESEIATNKTAIDGNKANIAINTGDIAINVSDILIGKKKNDEQDLRLSELEKLKPRVEINENDIAKLKLEDSKLETLVAGNTSKIGDNLVLINGNISDISSIKADLLTKEKQILKNATDIATNIKEIQQLKNTDSRHDTEIQALQVKVTSNLTEIQTLKGKVLALETWKGAVDGDLASIHGELQKLESWLQNLDSTLAALEKRVNDVECRLETIENLYADLKLKFDNFLKEFNAMKTEISEIEKRLCAIEKVSSTNSHKITDLETKLGSLLTKVGTYNNDQMNKLLAHFDTIANA